jgi:hypothetical protein
MTPDRLHEARVRLHSRRLLVCGAIVLLTAAPAHAEPLRLTFSGVIPQLTVQHRVEVFFADGSKSDNFFPFILSNVAVQGRVNFDADVWGLTQQVTPGSPQRFFEDVDPSSGQAPLGVDTPERITARLDVGSGIGALAFDRDILAHLPTGAMVVTPYEGQAEFGYVEGSETLSTFGFETGDYVFTYFSNYFGWSNPGDPSGPAGELVGEAAFHSLGIGILSSWDQTGSLQNIFGPGPPLAFSWTDPMPGNCFDTNQQATCVDGTGTAWGGFDHFSYTVVRGIVSNSFEVTTTRYGGGLIFTEMQLQAVPEPTSLVMMSVALGGLAFARRRRRQR